MGYSDPVTQGDLQQLQQHIDMRLRQLESTVRWSRSGEEFLPLLMLAPMFVILLVAALAGKGAG